jgi:fructosamine-3-kinase
MHSFTDHIGQQLSQQFNESVRVFNQTQVFGGDINQTFHLQTNIGSFFLKLNNGNLKDMFEKEFDGLQLLYQTKTIKIPQPVLQGSFENHVFLVTEFAQNGNASKNFWQTFAEQLAALHKHSNEQFGLSTNNYIGSLQQQNTFCNTWSEFYGAQRILPMMQLACSQHKCTKEDMASAERLCKRFPGLFPVEQAALLHGDLWSGNFMSDDKGRPVIFDPAVYYGNREMDIAMSLLFGGFDRRFYESYDEAYPLQTGWKERVGLCQLYPLLVHLNLFGGHYYYSVMDVIRKYS